MSMNASIRRHQLGASLVELMIAITIGMIVMAAALAVIGSTFGANTSQMRAARLNNEIRNVMNMITRDMRRAGYINRSIAQLVGGNYVPATNLIPTITPSATSGAISVAYDENNSGAIDAAEVYGYQLSGGAIQSQIGTAGTWVNITDPNVINVTAFAIVNNSVGPFAYTGAPNTVTVPTYQITITARLVSDTSVTRTVEETVRLRNPIIN